MPSAAINRMQVVFADGDRERFDRALMQIIQNRHRAGLSVRFSESQLARTVFATILPTLDLTDVVDEDTLADAILRQKPRKATRR